MRLDQHEPRRIFALTLLSRLYKIHYIMQKSFGAQMRQDGKDTTPSRLHNNANQVRRFGDQGETNNQRTMTNGRIWKCFKGSNRDLISLSMPDALSTPDALSMSCELSESLQYGSMWTPTCSAICRLCCPTSICKPSIILGGPVPFQNPGDWSANTTECQIALGL